MPPIFNQQLNSLLQLISNVNLNNSPDRIIWRWSTDGKFSTHSYYIWLDFGGISSPQFSTTWSAPMPLKIKKLVLRNKILAKDNLLKKGRQGDDRCVFC